MCRGDEERTSQRGEASPESVAYLEVRAQPAESIQRLYSPISCSPKPLNELEIPFFGEI